MRRYTWNKRKFAANALILLTVLSVNALVFWMLARWVLLGGAA